MWKLIIWFIGFLILNMVIFAVIIRQKFRYALLTLISYIIIIFLVYLWATDKMQMELNRNPTAGIGYLLVELSFLVTFFFAFAIFLKNIISKAGKKSFDIAFEKVKGFFKKHKK